jgi:hypothetical protein
MRYVSGKAFSNALEARLRTQSLPSGTPLVRLQDGGLLSCHFHANEAPAQPRVWRANVLYWWSGETREPYDCQT